MCQEPINGMDADRRAEGEEFVSRACSRGLHVKVLTLTPWVWKTQLTVRDLM